MATVGWDIQRKAARFQSVSNLQVTTSSGTPQISTESAVLWELRNMLPFLKFGSSSDVSLAVDQVATHYLESFRKLAKH